jgi:hypothetical protein
MTFFLFATFDRRHPESLTEKAFECAARCRFCVIPGHRAAMNPKPMNTGVAQFVLTEGLRLGPCAWVPGSTLRIAPE